MANGHAFNEVWEPSLGKWVFIDSHVSFYAVDPESRVPLSVLELRSRLLGEGGEDGLEVVPIVPDRFGFVSAERAMDWYRRGVPRMFLLQGNNVFSYDANPVIRFAESLPRSVEMVLAIVLGEHPRFQFVPADTQPEIRDQVEAMLWERVWVLVKLAAMAGLGLWLLVLLWGLVRPRARSASLETRRTAP